MGILNDWEKHDKMYIGVEIYLHYESRFSTWGESDCCRLQARIWHQETAHNMHILMAYIYALSALIILIITWCHYFFSIKTMVRVVQLMGRIHAVSILLRSEIFKLFFSFLFIFNIL